VVGISVEEALLIASVHCQQHIGILSWTQSGNPLQLELQLLGRESRLHWNTEDEAYLFSEGMDFIF
jgi:hypothetical protein